MRRLALAAALVVVLALVGCGSSKPKPDSATGTGTPGSGGSGTIVQDAKDNASIAACRTNRAQIDQQYSMAQSSGAAPAEFSAVLEQSGATCPSGGTYSWDAAAGRSRCSVHGE